MKKKIIIIALICTLASGCISISGCTTNQASSSTTESSFVSEYSAQYDFYSDSVEKLKDEMELTDEEADKVFGALLEVGLDEEISYCFDEKDDNDNPYFKVWWGSNKVDVYLKDNAVEKIFDGDKPIYPQSNEKLNISEKIIWKDDENMGIVNLKLDGERIKEAIINDYYLYTADYINELDKSELKDYEYIEFKGNVIKDELIECTISGKIKISDIKSKDEDFTLFDIEEIIYDLRIPKPLQ